MKSFFVLFLIILFSSYSQSQENKIIEVAEQFFAGYRNQDFMSVYNLLSKNDRTYISADSFVVFFSKEEDKTIRPGEPFIVSTNIKSELNDTVFVQQIVNRPDYNLIFNTWFKSLSLDMTNNVKFIDYFEKMYKESSLPMTIDSSLTIKIVNENSRFVADIEWAKYIKYKNLFNEYLNYATNQVKIIPQKIVLTTYLSTEIFANVEVEINNNSDYEISGINCKIIVDNIVIDEGNYFNAQIKPFKKLLLTESLNNKANPNLDKLSLSKPENTKLKQEEVIGAERIEIVPNNVYLKSYREIRKRASDESSFKGFSFIPAGINKGSLDNVSLVYKFKETDENSGVKSDKIQKITASDFLYNYLLEMDAGNKKKMSQLVKESLQELPKWLDDLMSVSGIMIKGSQGRPIMSWPGRAINAHDFSILIESIAEEYKSLTNNSKLLNDVKEWQYKYKEYLDN
ncbi:MAG: hypothetical protein CV087_09360 [Candidatus Brocadia sp. WS118]|nr:MAG: hypothetical protein CV087_09360 [Candidatus Brocadia sp. WS118]